MEFRKMVMITLYARQQKRHRCIEQSYGLCGRGRGLEYNIPKCFYCLFVFIWWKGWYLSCLAFFEIPGFVIWHVLGRAHGDPLQYSCLENPHGQKSLVGYSPWGHKESDTTKWLSTAHINFGKFSGNITSRTSSVISFLLLVFQLHICFLFTFQFGKFLLTNFQAQ